MLQMQFKGRSETWNSGVQIKKCRYLEASGCVALCVNLCKVGALWHLPDLWVVLPCRCSLMLKIF